MNDETDGGDAGWDDVPEPPSVPDIARPKGRAAKRLSKGGANAASKDAKCFAYSCEERCKGNSRFCRRHEHLKVAFCKRATTPEQKGQVDKILQDPLKSELALDHFGVAKDTYGIKANVDWEQVEESFTNSWTLKTRDKEILMDGVDYVLHREARIGRVAAKQEWSDISKDRCPLCTLKLVSLKPYVKASETQLCSHCVLT